MLSAYRRFYLYSALSLSLYAASSAVGALLALGLRAAGLGVDRPTAEDVRLTISLAAALLLFAVPIGLVHLRIIAASLSQPEERSANVRHFYLDLWIFLALMGVLIAATALASMLVGRGIAGDKSVPLSALLVSAAVAVVGWRWRRATPPSTPRWELDAAFGTMVIAVLVAAFQLSNAARAAGDLWGGRADRFAGSFADSDLRIGLAGAAVGLAVWAIAAWWAWPMRTARVRIQYLTFFYAIGVLNGAGGTAAQIAAIDAAARGRGDGIAGAWPALAAGALLVVLHGGGLLLDRGRNGRPAASTERLLLGLPALAGLGSILGAITIVWTLVVDHVLMPQQGAADARDQLGSALGPLVVGLALYPLTWRSFMRRSDAASAVRRFVVFTVVCLALVATVVAGVAAAFNVIWLAIGTSSLNAAHDALIWGGPAALYAGVFAGHLLLYRRDQRAQRAVQPVAEPSPADPLVMLFEEVAAGRMAPADAAAKARGLS